MCRSASSLALSFFLGELFARRLTCDVSQFFSAPAWRSSARASLSLPTRSTSRGADGLGESSWDSKEHRWFLKKMKRSFPRHLEVPKRVILQITSDYCNLRAFWLLRSSFLWPLLKTSEMIPVAATRTPRKKKSPEVRPKIVLKKKNV